MDNNKLKNIRHSLAHLLAAAVLELWPDTKITIGPVIENGFYYDFDFNPDSNGHNTDNNRQSATVRVKSEAVRVSDKDLPKIEKKMREILKTWEIFAEIKVTPDEAKKIFSRNPYKLELISELEKESEPIILYYSGPKDTIPTKEKLLGTRSQMLGAGFIDLCRGGHVKSAKEINPEAFKLSHVAGAYWRGDEKNKMLTRIYGLAFETKEELEEYERMMEEAKKRDHRKLGKALDLFTFSDLVGPGLPLFTPKGVIIIDELKKYIEEVCGNFGFKKVLTPHLAKISLYEHSGHAKKFGEELFHVTSPRNHEFVIRPVLCPHQTQIYASKPRSYRDLPIRYMETEKMYRAEKPGEVGGLNRVYSITVEDGHSFCRIDQVKEEVKNLVNIIKDFYTAIGMWEKHWVSLSVRDYEHPEKYIGEPEDWDKCEKILEEVSNEMNLGAKKMEGEAALYGPKLDFMFKDSLGKEIQIPTVQLDFATPKRFNLVYTNKQGKEEHPIMVHRAILGSYERFLALLIEHYGGAFPVWLSPVQVAVLPISDQKHGKYAKGIAEVLKKNGFRVELKEEGETLSKRILEARKEKIPYLIVAGDKEKKSKTITVEGRGDERYPNIKIEEFIKLLKDKVDLRK